MNEKSEIVDKQEYEHAVGECKRLITFIKIVLGKNIKVLSEKEYDHVHTEYGEIINAFKLSNGDDSIADIWNEYNTE